MHTLSFFFTVSSQRDGIVSPMVILAAVCCGFLAIVVLGGFLVKDEQTLLAQAGTDKQHSYEVEVRPGALPSHYPSPFATQPQS